MLQLQFMAPPPDVLPDVGQLVHAQGLEEVRIGAREDALLHEVDGLVRAHHDHRHVAADGTDAA